MLRREDSLFLGEIIKPSGRSSDLNGARYLQQWCDMRRQKFRDEAYNIPEPAERPDGHLSEDHVGAALGASGHLNATTISEIENTATAFFPARTLRSPISPLHLHGYSTPPSYSTATSRPLLSRCSV